MDNVCSQGIYYIYPVTFAKMDFHHNITAVIVTLDSGFCSELE